MIRPGGKVVLVSAMLCVLGLTACGQGDCGPTPSLDGSRSGAYVGRNDDSKMTIDEASGVVVIERTDLAKGRVVTTWRIRTSAEFYAAHSRADSRASNP